MITVTIKISYICKCINFAAKIVQGERRTKQTCLFFQPSRSLSYQKIVQGSHYETNLFVFSAEPQPILCASRIKRLFRR